MSDSYTHNLRRVRAVGTGLLMILFASTAHAQQYAVIGIDGSRAGGNPMPDYYYSCTAANIDYYSWPFIELSVSVQLMVDGNVIASGWDWGYNEVWVTVSGSFPATGSDQHVVCYSSTTLGSLYADDWAPGLPTGEQTASAGWHNPYDSAHNWIQTLIGGASFGGRVVTERDPGGGGPDTCWYPESIIPKGESISGGSWQVGSDNRWGPDTVGWTPFAVGYYRSRDRAPCDTSFPQELVITWPGYGEFSYLTTTLRAGITNSTVWSERSGQYAERIWP